MDRVGADSSQRSLANELRRLEEGKLGLGLHETQPPVQHVEDAADELIKQNPANAKSIVDIVQSTSKNPRTGEGTKVPIPVRPDLNADISQPPKPWTNEDPYVYLEPQKSDPWLTLKNAVDKYDDEMCKGLKEDVDTLLVFTGLFSAVVSAFCLESFTAQAPDPVATTNLLLLVISAQSANSTTAPASESLGEDFLPERSAVQTNVLYFVSLVLALSVSSVCILGKQWIRELQRDTAGSSFDAVRIRQARFDAFQSWKVPQILATLPVILQAALLLFFAGLLDQLWHSDDYTTAVAVSAIVTLTVFVVIATTVLPAYGCGLYLREKFTPFRSPQAWVIFIAYQRILQVFATFRVARSWAEYDTFFLATENEHSDVAPVTSVHRALRWVSEHFRNAGHVEKSLFWCLQSPEVTSILQLNRKELGLYVLCMYSSQHFQTHFAAVNYDLGNVGNVRGRFQAELLIKDANAAIEIAAVEPDTHRLQELWGRERALKVACVTVERVCDELCTFLRVGIDPQHDYRERKEQKGILDIEVIHDQVALMLQRFFHAIINAEPNQRQSYALPRTLRLLLALHATSTSPFAHELVGEVIHDVVGTSDSSFHFFPPPAEDVLDILRSKGILKEEKYDFFDLFTRMDKSIVRLIKRESRRSINSITRKDLQKWQVFRRTAIKSYTGYWNQNTRRYFNAMHPCEPFDRPDGDAEYARSHGWRIKSAWRRGRAHAGSTISAYWAVLSACVELIMPEGLVLWWQNSRSRLRLLRTMWDRFILLTLPTWCWRASRVCLKWVSDTVEECVQRVKRAWHVFTQGSGS